MSPVIASPDGATSNAMTRQLPKRTGGMPRQYMSRRDAGTLKAMWSDVTSSGKWKSYTEKSHLLYSVIVIEMQYQQPMKKSTLKIETNGSIGDDPIATSVSNA